MLDATSICNLALARIGQPRITSLDAANQTARYCQSFYDPTVGEVLRDHDWNFARKRATLEQLDPAPDFGWMFHYQLPSDCVTVRQINGFEPTDARPAWEVEGKTLLSDEAVVRMVYTARVDASYFDDLFIEALSLKLASKLCTPLTGSRTSGADFLREYEAIVSRKARRADASESRVKRKLPWTESDLVAARGGWGWIDPWTPFSVPEPVVVGGDSDSNIWDDSSLWNDPDDWTD